MAALTPGSRFEGMAIPAPADGGVRRARRTWPLRLPSNGGAILLAALALLAAEAETASQIVQRGRATALADARAAATAAAEGAATAVNRGFLAADSALAGLPNLLAAALPGGDGGTEAEAALRTGTLSRVLMGLVESSAGLRDLTLLPAQGGAPIASALPVSRRRPPPVPHAALLPEGTPVAGAGGRLTIAGPVPNPATGEWALFLSRRVSLPGLPPLLAVAELPVFVVAAELAGRGAWGELEGQRILLARSDDRVLLASAPHDEARIGRPLARALAEGVEAGRVIGLRRTLYPAINVVAVQDTGPALAGWQENERRILLAAGGLAILIVAITGLLLAMLRERDRAEAERARGRELLESSIEAMSDGFVMWDEQDRLIVCNQRYRDFYRESAPAIRPGATMTEIMLYGAHHGQYPQAGPDKARFVAEAMQHYRRAWNTAPVERLLPDGRWILVTERRVPGSGSVGIRTDITQQKRAAADLAAARDEAAAAGAAKSRFLARMSHELRTPLNGVLGMAQALASDPALPPAHRDRAAMLEAAGRHLLDVANDVLDLAHVEAGRMPLRRMPVVLVPLLEACAALIRPGASAAGIAVATEHDASLPEAVLLDPMRVRQLVLNLLSNAVKFSPEGGLVRLRSRCTAEGAGPPRLRLEVLDQGPGVPASERAKVFHDFVRLHHAAATPRSEGFGLGLAIAQGIVAAMSGRIGVEDNPDAAAQGGTGACFWVELPLEAGEIPELAPAPEVAAAHGLRSLRVLVVDDVQTNRLVAGALLERAGHRAELVESGERALAAVAHAAGKGEPFDAVLMDLAMPGMDGLEAARRLRALPPKEGGTVAVVALTAGVMETDIAACRATGMAGYLSKPLTQEALQAELARIVPASQPALG
ncbi:response regulator [Roseomonas sp. KE2513]|uniref:hybrid sensor histidine kinase/response regulator n=1 Tax=Roseomonas sp. KE2513 TaxID=2479202 RepID=UPI0018DF69E3|nr:PAS-domain containing protein [Roseomonas sp. KE2513]MBI0537370.1 response regulator [Roseomonas sp. KE2513]